MYRHSGLARSIDLRVRSNRIAVAGTGVAGLVALVVAWHAGGSPDVQRAASVAAAVFLSWALARELDPDHPAAGAVAMVVALGLASLGAPSAGVAAVVLIGARLVVGTVGSPPRSADLVVVLAVAAYAGTQAEGWAAAILVALGLILWMRPGFALLVAVAAALAAIASNASPDPRWPVGVGFALAAFVVAAALTSLRVPAMASTTDVGGKPLSPRRVRLAGLSVVVVFVVAAAVAPWGAVALSPVAAAIVAVAAVRLGRRTWPRSRIEAPAGCRDILSPREVG